MHAPPPENNNHYPLIVHALGTGESWNQHLYEDHYDPEIAAYRLDRNAIHLTMNAPLTGERRPRVLDTLQSLFDYLNLDINFDLLVNALVDLNFLNLEAARNQHIQYGADLHYSTRVAGLLPSILAKIDKDALTPEWAVQAPAFTTLSGNSLGGLATLHALAQGAHADNVTTFMTPRPSYIHVDSIFYAIFDHFPDMYDLVEKITGASYLSYRHPLMQWLQILLEPIDSLNYVELLNDKPIIWGFSPYNDWLHGGISSFSFVTGLQQNGPVVGLREAENGASSLNEYSMLSEWIDFNQIFNIHTSPYIHTQGTRFVLEPDGYKYNVVRCFPAALARYGSEFGSYLTDVANRSALDDCHYTGDAAGEAW